MFTLGLASGYSFDRVADFVTDPPGLRVHQFPADLVTQQAYKGTLIPGTPQTVPNPPDDDDSDLRVWAESHNGIDALSTDVHVTIQAHHLTLSLHRVRIVVASKTEPASGVYVGPKGAGSYFTYAVLVDLDKNPVAVEAVSDDYPEWGLPVTIDPHTVFEFSVVAITQSFLVEWWIELDYMVQGHLRVKRITDGAKPFVVTAVSAATHHWSYEHGRWMEP